MFQIREIITNSFDVLNAIQIGMSCMLSVNVSKNLSACLFKINLSIQVEIISREKLRRIDLTLKEIAIYED